MASKPSRGFLSRVFRRCAPLLIGLAAGFSAVAQSADTTAKKDAAVAEVCVAPDTAGIGALRNEFEKTASGCAALSFADQHDIAIVFDNEGVRRNRNYAQYWKGVASLRNDIPPADQVLCLAHELRHAYQEKALNYFDLESSFLKPEQRFILRQFLEADAAAYSAFFLAERMTALNLPPDTASLDPKIVKIAVDLKNEMQSAEGLTPEKFRKLALEPIFKSMNNYWIRHMNIMTAQTISDMVEVGSLLCSATIASSVGDTLKADSLLRQARTRVDSAPGDADFERALRYCGGTQFDTTVTTAFQDTTITYNMLVKDYARVLDSSTTVSVVAWGVMACTLGEGLDRSIEEATSVYDRLKKDLKKTAEECQYQKNLRREHPIGFGLKPKD